MTTGEGTGRRGVGRRGGPSRLQCGEEDELGGDRGGVEQDEILHVHCSLIWNSSPAEKHDEAFLPTKHCFFAWAIGAPNILYASVIYTIAKIALLIAATAAFIILLIIGIPPAVDPAVAGEAASSPTEAASRQLLILQKKSNFFPVVHYCTLT
ncbi:unnamed protein product [Miscanthus lutarioriparius]|uniref:Uncharacterized protein n=1 Tax=Miscanthus lutarioriparius TaxID=422564 RepID=A0A811MWM8_9POAL|nr:unnamed protein product [Miscanthus lutarioriparius]